MRFLKKVKDGGPESTVDAYFLIELKNWFSIAVLRFSKGSRTNYHTHAFNALTWFIKGSMKEHRITSLTTKSVSDYKFSLIPKVTKKDNLHKVIADKVSWCFTVRGPWDSYWSEYNEDTCIQTVLTHGRKQIKTIDLNASLQGSELTAVKKLF